MDTIYAITNGALRGAERTLIATTNNVTKAAAACLSTIPDTAAKYIYLVHEGSSYHGPDTTFVPACPAKQTEGISNCMREIESGNEIHPTFFNGKEGECDKDTKATPIEFRAMIDFLADNGYDTNNENMGQHLTECAWNLGQWILDPGHRSGLWTSDEGNPLLFAASDLTPGNLQGDLAGRIGVNFTDICHEDVPDDDNTNALWIAAAIISICGLVYSMSKDTPPVTVARPSNI